MHKEVNNLIDRIQYSEPATIMYHLREANTYHFRRASALFLASDEFSNYGYISDAEKIDIENKIAMHLKKSNDCHQILSSFENIYLNETQNKFLKKESSEKDVEPVMPGCFLPFTKTQYHALLSKDLWELNLSTRTINRFEKNNILHIGDIMKFWQNRAHESFKMTRKNYDEIRTNLYDLGLRINMGVEGWIRPNAEDKK